jgi:predicted ArsR family transcriptional regulator
VKQTHAQRTARPVDGLDALGVLGEPHRRALYEYVVGRQEWVGREEAADAVAVGRGVAAHHLDRLAEHGLLEIEFRRLNGRRGPGAGRTAKVYRRASTEIAVSLPTRDYELAGRLLARAAEQSCRDGRPIGIAIEDVAQAEGKAIAAVTKQRLATHAGVNRRRTILFDELAALGFEPAMHEGNVVLLHNCPFHQLAQSHTELICGMNLCLLKSLLDELGDTGWRAELAPGPETCCVRFETRVDGNGPSVQDVDGAGDDEHRDQQRDE